MPQHWVDFAGRKTSAKGRNGVVGSIDMADAALTQSSTRAVMAGYADSAASRQAAELRREPVSRIETLEAGLSILSTQSSRSTRRSIDSTLQALRSKGKGGQGDNGKRRH